MSADQPGQTALTAAASRAARLIVDDEPWIFAGRLAGMLLGDRTDEILSYHRPHGTHVILPSARAQVLRRASYAERAMVSWPGITIYLSRRSSARRSHNSASSPRHVSFGDRIT